MNEIRLSHHQRKIKRMKKHNLLFKGKPKEQVYSLSWWKERAWKTRSFRVRLDAKWKFGFCLICIYKEEKGHVEHACHIVRKTRGLAIYFEPKNLYGGCHRHNYAEHMNPGQYRDIHIKIFGRKEVERLEGLSKIPMKFSREDYSNMIKLDQENLSQISSYQWAYPKFKMPDK